MSSASIPIMASPRNAMTIDVEDYFQVQAFAHCIEKSRWEEYPCRVEANVDRLLAQFARAGVVGTFFTLGWVAERYRGMIRRIVAAGHELASHGYAPRSGARAEPRLVS